MTPVFTFALAKLTENGYTYNVVVSGERTDIGVGHSTIESFVLYDPDGFNVTESYNVVYEDGTIEVIAPERIIVKVMLFEIQKYYDGAPLGFEEGDYVVYAPDGIRIEINIGISLTNAGVITFTDINENIGEYLEFAACDIVGNDVSSNVKIIVEGYDGMNGYAPITVSPLPLEITAMSATKEYDGEELVCSSVYIPFGSLVSGHVLNAGTVGSITDVGESDNHVDMDRIVITDSLGEDVTDNYEITTVSGKLVVTPSDEQTDSTDFQAESPHS